jgi:zinc D-Ala-D-Ala carboxypeptidase
MSQFFTDDELACKCGCGKSDMDATFMAKLDSIRSVVARPFTVTSAYRCPEHNAKVSSTGENGPHTHGRAIDIRADSRLKYEIVHEAKKHGITRLGIAKSFIHIDDLTESAGFNGLVIWTY